MPDQVNLQLMDTVSAVNLKLGAGMEQIAMGASIQDLQQSQSRRNQLADSVLANQLNSAQQIQAAEATNRVLMSNAINAIAIKYLFDTSAQEAVTFAKEIASDTAQTMQDFGGVIAGIQQDLKGAQSTAPQTGTGGAFGSDAGSAILQQLANQQALMQSSITELTAAIHALATTKGT